MAAKKPFKVSTGDLVGELDPKRFGPCGKSVCILHEGSWLTPCEFRTKAKGSKSDSFMWKKSIKAVEQKKNLAYLITEGQLKQCEKECSCPNCKIAAAHQQKRRQSSGNGSSGQQQMAPLNVSVDDVKTAKDNDSDSGISNVSSNKAAAATAAPPPAAVTASPAKFTSTQLTSKEPSTLPDYPFMVREAIVSVTSGMPPNLSSQGCSRLCVLLYILNKYKPQEDVCVVNEKIKGALRLLSTMEVVGGANDEDDEDEDIQVDPPSVEDQEPPQLTVRSAQASKPKGTKKATKEKVAAKVRHKDDDEDSEVKFKPSQFYPKVANTAVTVSKSDAAAAASAVAAPKAGRPKLSVKNSDKDQAKKVKKAALSVAKENRDKVKAVKKVKKVVKELAADGTTVVKKVKKVKKLAKELGANQRQAGFNVKPLKLSTTLQAILGKQPLTRNAAVKNIWVYIKAKNLQDPDEKRTINCDAKMKALTKRDKIQSSEIFAALTEHMEKTSA